MSDAAGVLDPQAPDAGASGAGAEGEIEAEVKSNRGRAGVSYLGKGLELEVLDELPASVEAEKESRKSRQYYDILESVGENAATYGKWVPIVKFSTPNGAMAVCNRMRKQLQGNVMDEESAEKPAKDRNPDYRGWLTPDQTTEIPEYEGWHWEFDFRRVNSERGANELDSILYARILPDEGTPEQAPEPEPEPAQ
jgi:hypothetical protein